MSDVSRTKRESEHVMLYNVPTAGVLAGSMRLVSGTIGVAQENYILGDIAVLITESELIKLPKSGVAGVSFIVGEKLYFDAATGLMKKTAGGYHQCAVAKRVAGATDTYVVAAFDGEHYTTV